MLANKITLFSKDGWIGALGVIYTEKSTVITSFEPSLGQVNQFEAEYGDPASRSYESQVEVSVERGWNVIFSGASPLEAINNRVN